MAPMVAASDYPYRLLLRKYGGVDLLYTQMLHAKNFVNDQKFHRSHCDFFECTGILHSELLQSQKDCLGPEGLEKYLASDLLQKQRSPAPLMVQLAGDNIDTVVSAAMKLYEETDGRIAGIDLNCGCPQQIASSGNYGAFLMERDSRKVCDILSGLRRTLPQDVAVSAKIRLPPEDETLKDRVLRLLDTGIDFLTIHGRTLKENKTKVRQVHADRIRMAVEIAHAINPEFPVVANGGMETYEDVQQIMQYTGASAAMASEKLLENPALFMPPTSLNTTPQDMFQKQTFFARKYLELCSQVGPPLPGVMGQGGSFAIVRGHLFKFLHRYLSEQLDLRNQLAAERMTLAEAMGLVDKLEGRYESLTEEEWNALESSKLESSWYRRHRKPDRRVHERGAHTADHPLDIESRKRQMRERIAKMKTQRRESKALV
jgi:tRNA-dihydrouridine synthase